ncbi:uncharacterized protein A4U43_C09F3420 [Asparagus officinalis]|uniref:Uncharacterized protein n=1 Tax=Asparagus officinalis TaxID=4686 RepID=A0A5P1E6U3_ASPOF|nr:uncharacterized protein A4U43_C09F3420 [Asparagus officinalis]
MDPKEDPSCLTGTNTELQFDTKNDRFVPEVRTRLESIFHLFLSLRLSLALSQTPALVALFSLCLLLQTLEPNVAGKEKVVGDLGSQSTPTTDEAISARRCLVRRRRRLRPQISDDLLLSRDIGF